MELITVDEVEEVIDNKLKGLSKFGMQSAECGMDR
jgi:hypothetical protein